LRRGRAPNRIAFERTETLAGGTQATHIYTLEVPASGAPSADPVQITTGTVRDTAPAWAPKVLPARPDAPVDPDPPIAFERSTGGNRDLFIVAASGGAATNLTDVVSRPPALER